MNFLGNFNEALANVKGIRLDKRLIIGAAVVLVVLITALGCNLYLSSNLAPVDKQSKQKVVVNIPAGSTSKQIAEILKQNHLINNSGFFAWYAGYTGVSSKLRSGIYTLSPSQDVNSLLASLERGPIAVKITIPEGFTTKQIADLLAAHGLINKQKFYKLVNTYDFKYDFLQGIPHSDLRLEGFLFPATYEIVPGTPEKQIIEMMLKRFDKELTPSIRQVIKQKGWSVQQFITLASLIEREAKMQTDKPVVSQVFQSRLKIGMPLQSNASVEFLFDNQKPNLSLNDIRINSPYNTYLHPGLPPGPIANPGDASIQAAAFPSKTDYLYFVAKPDGYTAFAKTYAEHLKNVQKYVQ